MRKFLLLTLTLVGGMLASSAAQAQRPLCDFMCQYRTFPIGKLVNGYIWGFSRPSLGQPCQTLVGAPFTGQLKSGKVVCVLRRP